MRDQIADFIVLAGLAGFVVWTYVVLPLAYFHS
jgi:hypothetical protein